MDETLKQRIAALLRKARADGASEAEALAAAQRAARLMQEAGVTEDDIIFDQQQAGLKHRSASARDKLWATVALCTNCAALTQHSWTPSIIFVGKAPGPQIAVYLVEVLGRSLDREVAAFKRTAEFKRRRTLATKRQAVQDFLVGLVQRLCLRLKEFFASTTDPEALDASRAVLDIRFPGTVKSKIETRQIRFGSAAGAGYAAGGRVQIAHGVSGTGPVRMIGRHK